MPAEIPHAGLISIHAPRKGERRKFYVRGFNRFSISIHAPRKGERLYRAKITVGTDAFQSTLPTRGSDIDPESILSQIRCFNPRSPRGGATWDLATDDNAENVSIHAPHEGERRSACRRRLLADGVSIHAPHEGERRIRCPTPVRRSACFNPRSPRGGATTKTIIAIVANMFQSTLPTRGSDYMTHAKPNRATKFQSTLPTRGSDAQL